MDNPSPTKAAEYQRRRYVTGGADWRLKETSSSGVYGKVKLAPSLTSDLGNQNVIPARIIQQKRSYLGRKKKRRTNTVHISTRNRFFCLLRLLMICLERRIWSYSKIWVESWQKNGRTHFARVWLDQWSDQNRGR